MHFYFTTFRRLYEPLIGPAVAMTMFVVDLESFSVFVNNGPPNANWILSNTKSQQQNITDRSIGSYKQTELRQERKWRKTATDYTKTRSLFSSFDSISLNNEMSSERDSVLVISPKKRRDLLGKNPFTQPWVSIGQQTCINAIYNLFKYILQWNVWKAGKRLKHKLLSPFRNYK